MNKDVSMQRRIGMLLVGGTVLAASLISTSSAYAADSSVRASGNCGGTQEEKVVNNALNDWRVRARCSSLGANSKARGVLDIPGDVDTATSYFTVLNTNRYSSYRKSAFGDPTGRAEIVPV